MDFNQKITRDIRDSVETKIRVLNDCTDTIEEAGKELALCLETGGKVLLCGNGGSAADCQHIAAELVVRLRGKVNRKALPALALTVDTSILTAGGNDYGYDNVFSRQVEAYGTAGDILIAISTSGNSANVLKAIEAAKQAGMKTIGLTGGSGGKMAGKCDITVTIPSDTTARIQESHIMTGHIWCEMIEEILFPEMFGE